MLGYAAHACFFSNIDRIPSFANKFCASPIVYYIYEMHTYPLFQDTEQCRCRVDVLFAVAGCRGLVRCSVAQLPGLHSMVTHDIH